MYYIGLCDHHLEDFLKIRNSCREFLHNDQEFTLEECKEWFKNLPENQKYIKISTDTHEMMGYFRLKFTFEPNEFYCVPFTPTVEIGMDLAEKYRGQGLAYKYYLDYMECLARTGFKRFTLSVLASNIRAYNLYKKIGFHPVGYEDHVRSDGKFVISIQMIMNWDDRELIDDK